MVDVKDFTDEELVELAEAIVDELAERDAAAKVKEEQEKAERAERFKNELSEGDVVSFLYGRTDELVEGTVVRVSDKTVTVHSDSFDKNKYVRFDRFVEILEKAEDEAVEEEAV